MKFRTIDVKPLSGALGAEVFGPDLSKKLDDRTFGEIHRALLDNMVIFFRDQSPTPRQLLRFARRFGPIQTHPFMAGLPDCPQVLKISRTPADPRAFGNVWHSDQMFQQMPAMGTILHGVTIPEAGGDTVFANMSEAYDALSPGMRRMLTKAKVFAVGDGFKQYGGQTRAEEWRGKATMKVKAPPKRVKTEAAHPIVRTHPVTKRKGLYFGHHVQRFDGMTDAESEAILDFLGKHVTRPEFTCRFRWTEGAIAFWDNRCTQHYAVDDYCGETRIMHRVTIRGDRPF